MPSTPPSPTPRASLILLMLTAIRLAFSCRKPANCRTTRLAGVLPFPRQTERPQSRGFFGCLPPLPDMPPGVVCLSTARGPDHIVHREGRDSASESRNTSRQLRDISLRGDSFGLAAVA